MFECFVFVQSRHAQSRIVTIWRIVAFAANEKAMVSVESDDPVQGRQYTRPQVQKVEVESRSYPGAGRLNSVGRGREAATSRGGNHVWDT